MKERNRYPRITNNLALHIEAVNLADGDYELVPVDSRVDQEAILNCANLSQDLGQPQRLFCLTVPKKASPGALCLISELLFIYLIMMCCNSFFLH